MLPCHLRKPQPNSVRFMASSSGLKVFWVVGLGWIYEGVEQKHKAQGNGPKRPRTHTLALTSFSAGLDV